MKANHLGIYEWGLEEGRAMIGKKFTLLKPYAVTNEYGQWIECQAGAPCVVWRVVDFGEGLMIGMMAAGRELNDFDKKEFAEYFKERPQLKLAG